MPVLGLYHQGATAKIDEIHVRRLFVAFCDWKPLLSHTLK